MTRHPTSNHWILVVREQRIGGKVVEALDILQNRLRRRFWAFAPRAKGVKGLKQGDRAVIYASGRHDHAFIGLCRIASNPYPLPAPRHKLILGHAAASCVDLDDIHLFPKPIPITRVMSQLQFIQNPHNWGAYLQGSAIRISEADYRLLAQATPAASAEGDTGCPPHHWRDELLTMHGETVTLRRCILCGVVERA